MHYCTLKAVGTQPRSGIWSFDCWGVVDGPMDVYSDVGLSWAIPVVLLLLSWCCFGIRSWRMCLVVWGNVFIPPLCGAAAKLVPCFTTQEGGQRLLMYEAAFGTLCSATAAQANVLPRIWLLVATVAVLVLIGPILWLSLAVPTLTERHGKEDDATIGFLVAGYEYRYRWWEVTVLARKAAIFVVAAWFPMSWAPGAHLVYLILIMVFAELIHGSIRPYISPRLDRLEGQALGVSCICLVLVTSLLAEWPFRPYAIYVGTCVLLFLLTAGAYLYFLRIYIRAVLAKDHATEEAEDDSEETEDFPGGAAARLQA